ncbi:carboxymuconolactone decarboxylase family protein [Brevibacillus sp. B_LB10_24]|uniref:carboxymuconolactone decarboxylase family protein n=1 Tax=Brevibacillus sp. B_LB10_24 TaxID=3380645 RepID=UPI0038B9B66D
MAQNNQAKQTLADDYQKEMGHWNATLQYLVEHDENFFEIYKTFVTIPYKNNGLDAKTRELLQVALSASPTSLHKETLEIHMRNAIAQGATEQEIFEVLKVVSVLGVHTCAVGVPILVEELGKDQEHPKEWTDSQSKRKAKFIETMGYWNAFRETLLDNDEHFFDSYYDYLTDPWHSDILSPKLKEFIYIAIDSSTTHLFEAGIRVHIRNALKYGATFEEIMEVYKLTSAQGVNTFYVGIPILQSILSEMREGNPKNESD